MQVAISKESLLEDMIGKCQDSGLFDQWTVQELKDHDLIVTGLIDSMTFFYLQSLIAEQWNVMVPPTLFMTKLRTLDKVAEYVAMQFNK